MINRFACMLLLVSSVAAAPLGQAALEEGAAKDGAAPKALRYGTDDLREIAKDPGHPLADFVAERLNKREPVPSVWADVASQYVELGYHADAWAIQKAMLQQFVSAELSLPDDTIARLLKGVTKLPERFRKWGDTESEMFSFFGGRQTSPRAAESLRRIIFTLDRIGQKEKSLSLARRFVAAYPNDIIGSEALNTLPSVAALYRQIAAEQKGKRVGATAQLKLGETFGRQNKLPDAVMAYKEYLDIYPEGFEVPDALRALTDLCEQTHDYDAAIQCSEALLKHLAGKEAIAVSARIARFHQELGHRKEYVATYMAIGEKYGLWNPTDTARTILGGAEYAQEHQWSEEAAMLYDACIQVVAQANNLPLDKLPRSVAAPQEQIAFWKACLNVAADDTSLDSTILAFVQKNARSREAAYGRYVLCRLALDAQKIQEALEEADALTALLPDAPAAQRLEGEVRAKIEGIGQSYVERRVANEGLGQTRPGGLDEADAVYRLAQLHAKAGQTTEAVESLAALADEWPESPLAARALFDKATLCRDALKDPDRAQATLERLLVLYPDTDLGVKAFQLLSRTEPAPAAQGEATQTGDRK